MQTCHTEIILNAPISTVWAILTDFDRYPEWNPLIGKIRGSVEEGNLVFAHVLPLKSYFPVKINSFKLEREIIWKGTVLSSNLMEGEHYYLLKAIGDDKTALQHGETFSGLASHFMPLFLVNELQDAYEYHNEKLKIIVEQGEL